MTSSRLSDKPLIIADPVFKEHLTGYGHPEQPKRYDAIMESINDLGLSILSPRAASVQEVALCHAPDYIELVKMETERIKDASSITDLSTGDAVICSASYSVALKAAGGVLTAVDAVMTGKTKRAFCAVRPPGHHATKDRGMGFCLFNNIAIGARYAQKKYPIKRVLIVDWDVHHGNGTQDIFYDDPSIYYFSTHQFPLYPGTGSESETGSANTICNQPISGGKGSRDHILEAFRTQLPQKMNYFKPELVMISAGFDAHRDDPIGGCDLTVEDYGELTHLVVKLAEQYAEGRVVSVLEGGYNLDALGECARAHVMNL